MKKSPSPTLIRTTRLALGLTQQQSGALVGASARTWRSWEAGFRAMPGSKWELFQIKTRHAFIANVVKQVGITDGEAAENLRDFCEKVEKIR